jgi:hypothetical protein
MTLSSIGLCISAAINILDVPRGGSWGFEYAILLTFLSVVVAWYVVTLGLVILSIIVRRAKTNRILKPPHPVKAFFLGAISPWLAVGVVCLGYWVSEKEQLSSTALFWFGVVWSVLLPVLISMWLLPAFE